MMTNSRHLAIWRFGDLAIEISKSPVGPLTTSPRHQSPRRPTSPPRAFSLVEVMMAIVILGIGIISIAALFPAGIAQQRMSVDDVMGPVVADNALSILRSKLAPDDFGSFYAPGAPHPTVQGDFGWQRPAFIMGPTPAESGINIFRSSGSLCADCDTLSEIPYNEIKYDDPTTVPFDPTPPEIRFTQGERYYPMAAVDFSVAPPRFRDERLAKPQYVWDCMFRRFQGKILVAIFVYRVTVPGGGPAEYSVQVRGVGGDPTMPYIQEPIPPLGPSTGTFIPWKVSAGATFNPVTGEPMDIDDDGFPDGLPVGDNDNPDELNHAWQEPRQWILDQNNNIHRVLGQYRTEDSADDRFIELIRPVPGVQDTGPGGVLPIGSPYFVIPPTGSEPQKAVTRIAYLPLSMQYDADGDSIIQNDEPYWNITPVFVTVKEL